MTNGGFAAIAVALRAVSSRATRSIFLSPPWFFYEILILAAGGDAGPRAARRPTFDLDLPAIDDAITPRTRAVLINTPHNPSGRVFVSADLQALGDALRASLRPGRPPDLPRQRRALQPDRLRRADVPQPGGGVRQHDHHVLVSGRRCSRRGCGSAT